MNEQYITISESVTLTGKSAATIRRLINQMDNQMINQMTKREGSGNKAKILIKRSFLEKEYGLSTANPTTENASPVSPVNDNVIEILREQLAIKDGQIQALSNQVSHLIESKRHSDVLLKNLHDSFLALPQPQEIESAPTPRRTLWSRIFGR